MVGIIHIGIDPVALHVGALAIHWYGVLYAVAFVTAYRFGVRPHVEARGVTRAEAERWVTIVIIAGLVSARLYYDIQQPLGQYIADPVNVIAVWQGGMDFFGAIFGASAAIAVIAWRERRSLWMLLDAGALFAVVGQPIGRIGNIINGDILGAPSTLPWATAYDNPHAVLQPGFHLGIGYQPAGAYEALVTLAIGVVLFAVRRRHAADGVLFLLYFAAYAVTQFLIFFVRQSEPAFAWGLKQSQWTSLGMLVIGMPLLIWLWRRRILAGGHT